MLILNPLASWVFNSGCINYSNLLIFILLKFNMLLVIKKNNVNGKNNRPFYLR